MTQKEREREKQRQKQREEQRKRSLHRKHHDRRKKDMIEGMPFIVGFQGDPAMGGFMFCDQIHTFKLIAPHKLKPFSRLKTYQKKPIKSIFRMEGKVLIKEAK
jgi:hypothetical protein